MVNCKRLKATVPESTCIARQRVIARDRSGADKADMKLSCKNCETGLRLLKGELKKMKTDKKCTKCGNTLPATLSHFDPAPRAADKLTNQCKACRAKEAGVELSPPPPTKIKKPKKIKSHKIPASQERQNLHLNISTVPGLYAALAEKAANEMRTPLAQALWILKEELV